MKLWQRRGQDHNLGLTEISNALQASEGDSLVNSVYITINVYIVISIASCPVVVHAYLRRCIFVNRLYIVPKFRYVVME